ncbi:hypothetical protein [Pseudorhodoferax soli]|uniref:Uncharacterized protein n=1 Tax=Pseudorhodoferax soli TaxID=545864 RepID=A0A368XPL2_9BURK|nr:hypothetical protein [Pseudorhodoferax soli]RCW69479.1 hypothetical protein DES41_106353 [Pseudorhodoferax soli]
MKKLLLATSIVIAQAASMTAFAQSTSGGTNSTPNTSVQANGEKGNAPAGPKPDMAGTNAPGAAANSSSAASRGTVPAPTTATMGEKARTPTERKPATGSADTAGRPSTGERKAAPAPSAEANGEKADKKGGVGDMKPAAPAK